jgi:hypothetical protein
MFLEVDYPVHQRLEAIYPALDNIAVGNRNRPRGSRADEVAGHRVITSEWKETRMSGVKVMLATVFWA